MMQSLSSPDPSGLEPQLGGDALAALSGYEPLLGGLRRVGADVDRIQALINAPDEAERRRLLRHVIDFGQGAVYAAELVQVVPVHARQQVGNYRGSFTPGQRCAAMEALAEIGSYESIPVVVEALADELSQVRKSAEESLQALCRRLPPSDRRTRIVYRLLVDALRVLPLFGRKVVARILADSPADLVLGPLIVQGLRADEWWARRESAWVLGALGDKRAARRLIDSLDDPSAAVRTSAAWALGHLEAPVALKPLTAALADRDEVVRAAVVEALGAHAARLSALDSAFVPTVEQIIARLEDEDFSVRHAAIDALSALDSPENRPLLRDMLNR